MNVLLTGGAGYIGTHCCVALSDKRYNCVLLDNFSNSNPQVLDSLERILGKSISCVEGDVREFELVKEILSRNQIDAVVHFAGLKAVGESVQQPLSYYSNNIEGALSLVRAMDSLDIRTLVFSSSATVYGEPRYLPLDEDHPVGPTNPYGRCKMHIEEMLRDIAISNSNWRIASLRYFNPVGAHESGLIGERPSGVPNNLVPYISQVASGDRSELQIFGDDYPTRDGTGIRDYVHVVDVAQGHVAALDFLTRCPGFQVFNLGTGSGSSVLQVIKSFEKASSREIPYKIVERRSGDIAESFADSKKASRVLNWRATKTLDDMCKSAWKFQSNNQSAERSK